MRAPQVSSPARYGDRMPPAGGAGVADQDVHVGRGSGAQTASVMARTASSSPIAAWSAMAWPPQASIAATAWLAAGLVPA